MTQVKINNKENKCVLTVGPKTISISGWKKTIINPLIVQSINDGVKEWDVVRLSVLFKTIGRLESMTDVDKIFLHVKSMMREMCYYWYAQIMGNNNVKELRNRILN